jgi:hypothetical protein
MSEPPTPRGDGCLVCLLQASDSMRETAFSGPLPTKIAAALGVLGRLFDDLALFAAESPADPRNVDVGVLAYSTRRDGKPRLRPLLPGSSPGRPLLPLESVAGPADGHLADGHSVKIQTEPSGEAPARAAMTYASGLLARWAAEHPGASPPVLVHCTDGQTSDGPIDSDVASLLETVPGAVIVHCLFRRGTTPSALVPIPETPCGDLWAMSSPYPIDGAADGAEAPAYRALFVNKLSAARGIVDIIRRLWSRAEPPVAEAPPADPGEAEVDSVPDSAAAPAIAESAPEASPYTEPAAEAEPPPEPPEPAGPPRFEFRALWMPKRGNDEREWEDGFAADAAGGIVAVADGASDGIFSKLWVDMLLDSFVRQPVALDDPAAVEPWIQERRRQWFEAIRYPEQRWSIQLKIDRSCGASTFLALRLEPAPPGGDPPDEAIGWTAWVVGDICLFHIRDGELVASFPIAASADFNTTPQLYQSKAMRPTPRAVVTRGELRSGDLLVFATDATAQRLLAEVESGTPPDWGRFWDLDQETWRREIEAIRDQNAMVNDDCTLVVLRAPSRVAIEPIATGPDPGAPAETVGMDTGIEDSPSELDSPAGGLP